MGSSAANDYKLERTTVDAKDAIVDDYRKREEIEHVREVRPDVRRAILAHTLCVETVCL